MKLRNVILAIVGIIVAIVSILILRSLQNTTSIWLLTRGFGLLAFAALFFVILLGELRMLGVKSMRRLHCPTAVLMVYFAFLHGVTALFDRFRYGESMRITDYLGFSFSDKWLILLSMGTLAFYLIVLVSITSSAAFIRSLGFRRWKMLHYVGYVTLMMVFIHSIFLGTDLTVSAARVIVFPILVFLFAFIGALTIVRIAKGSISSRAMAVMILLVLLVSASAAVFADTLRRYQENNFNNQAQKDTMLDDLTYAAQKNDYYLNLLGDLDRRIRSSESTSRGYMDQIDSLVASTNASIKAINNSVQITYVTQVVNNTREIVYVPEIRYVDRVTVSGENDD
jgi:methionine sulfoxide reductase heme-binding subunit